MSKKKRNAAAQRRRNAIAAGHEVVELEKPVVRDNDQKYVASVRTAPKVSLFSRLFGTQEGSREVVSVGNDGRGMKETLSDGTVRPARERNIPVAKPRKVLDHVEFKGVSKCLIYSDGSRDVLPAEGDLQILRQQYLNRERGIKRITDRNIEGERTIYYEGDMQEVLLPWDHKGREVLLIYESRREAERIMANKKVEVLTKEGMSDVKAIGYALFGTLSFGAFIGSILWGLSLHNPDGELAREQLGENSSSGVSCHYTGKIDKSGNSIYEDLVVRGEEGDLRLSGVCWEDEARDFLYVPAVNGSASELRDSAFGCVAANERYAGKIPFCEGEE